MTKIDHFLPPNDTHRRIIHLDMDAFYASVETRDHPEYRHKALVIAHDPRQHQGHGVITTANYFARRYGVHSAMPAVEAVRQIPSSLLVFVPPHFAKYRRVSAKIHQIMHQVTDRIQSVALDEAYLDVTKNKLGPFSAIELGNYLQKRVYQETGLTCSFGATYNKFLAKMASEYAKPFGKTVILPEEASTFLAHQRISNFPGIGRKTQVQLAKLGLITGHDLQMKSVAFLVQHFKKLGYMMALHAHGIDFSPVQNVRQRKSIGRERTFEPSIYDRHTIEEQLKRDSQFLSGALVQHELLTDCIVLKIRDRHFKTVTRREKLPALTQDPFLIEHAARQLFEQLPQFLTTGVRLVGVSVTNLKQQFYHQLNLFTTG